MGLFDFILFPVYVLLFHLFFKARRKRIQDPILQKYHKQFFWIKVASAFVFAFFSIYVIPGDSIALYYPEGVNLSKLIWKDSSNLKFLYGAAKDFDESVLADNWNAGYLKGESNYAVVRFVIIFYFLSFGRYLVITLMFSIFSFTGVWRLYRFFYELYPKLHKELAIAIIYLPTFIFWSSGVLKDPLCTGMLGWLTFALFQLLYKKKHLVKNLIIIAFASTLLAIVKMYILVSYLPFFLLFIIIKNIHLIKNPLSRIVLGVSLVIMGISGFFIVADRLKDEMGMLAVDKITESVKTQQSNYMNMADLASSSFSLGVEFDGSPSSMMKMAPAAIIATLFRPFIWESKKISTLLSSLESLALMLFTLFVLFKTGFFHFFKFLFTDSTIFFCFSFSILFALFVGATTLNFGTLVRYKTPCIPFYIISMILIYQSGKKRKSSHQLVPAAAQGV